jgi:hypothetical protein
MLKVNEKNSRIRIQDPDPNLLVRSMDSRIRIHPKMAWIRNTASNYHSIQGFSLDGRKGKGGRGTGTPARCSTTSRAGPELKIPLPFYC